MTALSVERKTQRRLHGYGVQPVADNVQIWGGSLLMLDAGYAKPGATAAGKICAGKAVKNYDNTAAGHAAGAFNVEYEEGEFRWANGDSIAQADVGKVAYISDDQTVTKGNAGQSPAGIITGVEAGGVWVRSSVELSKALAVALAAEPASSLTAGTGTLVNGTATIADTAVTASSKIILTRKSIAASTALGEFEVPTRTASTSFVVNARKPADHTTETGDQSTFDYLIVG